MNRLPTTKEWFLLNLKIGALSFGGSGRILLYQDEVVDRQGWVSQGDYNQIMTMAQVFPGPNLVNLAAYLGFRLAGVRAAILGVLGLCLPGAFPIAFVWALDLNNPNVQRIFQGFAIGSVALFFIFLWRFAAGLFDGPHRVRVEHRHRLVRIGITAVVTGLAVAGVHLTPLILIGALVSIVIEFGVGSRRPR